LPHRFFKCGDNDTKRNVCPVNELRLASQPVKETVAAEPPRSGVIIAALRGRLQCAAVWGICVAFESVRHCAECATPSLGTSGTFTVSRLDHLNLTNGFAE
jgi:hypothetical protein